MGQDEADAMFGALDRAAQSYGIRAAVATNSRTYARQAADRVVTDAAGPGVLQKGLSIVSHPQKAAQNIWDSLTGNTADAQLAREDHIWGQVADLLTRPVNQGGGTILQALQGVATRQPAIDGRRVRSPATQRALSALVPVRCE